MQSCHGNDLKSSPRSDRDINVKDEHEELNKIISGKWDPSSSIRDQTCTHCIGSADS